MKNTAPAELPDFLDTLRALRSTLQGRLDAVDLSIENLSRVWTEPAPMRRPKTQRLKGKRSKPRRLDKTGSAADDRRAAVLAVITAAEHGVTLRELREHTPKITGKDRSNALYRLKLDGKIRRVGNTWKAA